MKKLAFLGGAAGLGLMALLHSPIQAADHLDSATVAMANQKMADLNDVYAWMTTDGTKINLALTVSPFDNGNQEFGASVQYVFHLTRFAAFPQGPTAVAAGEESKAICTFESATMGQCWIVDPAGVVIEYVKGDFSATTGVTSVGGKLKAFAGRRSDPFFFNLAGFLTAQKKVEYACGGNTSAMACPGVLDQVPNALDDAGCPQFDSTQVTPIALDLKTAQPGPSVTTPLSTLGPCAADQLDCFAGKNVMAIVLQVDKTLVVNDTRTVLGVWASTHAAP